MPPALSSSFCQTSEKALAALRGNLSMKAVRGLPLAARYQMLMNFSSPSWRSVCSLTEGRAIECQLADILVVCDSLWMGSRRGDAL